MKIKDVLIDSCNILKQSGIENPMQKTKIAVANILNMPKEYLMIHDDEEINKTKIIEINEAISKLSQGIPLQYIINKQEFMKLNFFVDDNVLIPQPDTEILAEECINLLKKEESEKLKVLDLCTGSGCIGISIAKYVQNARVHVSDISFKALQIAKYNAERNMVHRRMRFIESDMFEDIKSAQYDMIVSNPPYIETEIIETLDIEVQNEPIMALDGGDDGLRFYRDIAKDAYKYLKKNGYLCLEIGYNQKENVIEILKKVGEYKDIYSKKDLSGNDRIIIAKKRD